mmetsp:Transcript_9799/g.21211  ORF Transcript_9799/g.21211 Transcript_9799/m.21211 type:complete len:656 (-) Transcript_9799:1629-3596(-)
MTTATPAPVNILGCGRSAGAGVIYAIAVSQPVQSWTVLRSHDDFLELANALPPFASSSLPCPTLKGDAMVSQESMEQGRHELQQWLSTILYQPGVSDSAVMRQFLTDGANMIPPSYENITWTTFTATAAAAPAAAASAVEVAAAVAAASNVDDMDMDDMFGCYDDALAAQPQPEDQQQAAAEEDIAPPASERYKPVNEGIAEEDEMDIMQYAGEVEMIEDIGSLAQSMGASHLGRSLQLQAETKQQQKTTGQHSSVLGIKNHSSGGIKMGAAPPPRAPGRSSGIGMAIADPTAPTDFNQQRPQPVSPPSLDSFKMIKVIGKGSFGKVFLVREIKTGETYALKVLRKDNIIKRNQVEHTKTERSVLGYVKHPFIVGLNMAFQTKDKLFFVLDYCAGGELFFHLGKLGRFPEDRAKFYAAEIVLAIDYVHSLDIVYRDLKPENVLLDHRGHIRLTDFGLSKEGIVSSSSGANSFCGTPEYLAPEILDRLGHGRAVDWWSLGALLYEMLTGLPPFYCQERERLFQKIRRSELTYPSTVRPDAKVLLKGLLTKDPQHRVGSGPEDAEEIKRQAFFSSISWDGLSRGEIEPPWVPKIKSSVDTSQFDKEFTAMPIFSPQSMQRGGAPGFGTTPASGDNPFDGFTFTDHQIFLPAQRAGSD